MARISVDDKDIIEIDNGIFEYKIVRDYFWQPKLVLLPFDEERHERNMKKLGRRG